MKEKAKALTNEDLMAVMAIREEKKKDAEKVPIKKQGMTITRRFRQRIRQLGSRRYS